MTEALRLPGGPHAGSVPDDIGAAPDGGAAGPHAVTRPRAAAAPAVRAKSTSPRRPLHIAVAVGLSAGAYAASLAGVTALQAASDQSLADQRAPTADAIQALSAGHDQLQARLGAAAAAYSSAAAAYNAFASQLGTYEGKLGSLATNVGQIHGASVAMPSSVRLPSVSRSAASAPKPASHATTSASGKP